MAISRWQLTGARWWKTDVTWGTGRETGRHNFTRKEEKIVLWLVIIYSLLNRCLIIKIWHLIFNTAIDLLFICDSMTKIPLNKLADLTNNMKKATQNFILIYFGKKNINLMQGSWIEYSCHWYNGYISFVPSYCKCVIYCIMLENQVFQLSQLC